MTDLDSTLGVASRAEEILVEKSQDSLRVTKDRLHRASLTQEEELDSEQQIVDPRQDSIAHAHRQGCQPRLQREAPWHAGLGTGGGWGGGTSRAGGGGREWHLPPSNFWQGHILVLSKQYDALHHAINAQLEGAPPMKFLT
jgi:hypothetical protein